MLEFSDVQFQYPNDEEKMINGLSFSVSKGEFVSIIGESGCGKSTIFRLINALEKPNQGTITVYGKDITSIKNYSAYMPQKDLLFPWRTIEKNVSLPMELAGVSKEERSQRAEAILKEVGLLEYRNHFPKELSGGMKQRASFARTILTGSELLLLDEPFSALDSLTKLSMQEWLLTQYHHFHKTVLFITHDVEEAIFLSNRIFIVQDRPVTKFEEVIVTLPYPRNRSMFEQPEIVVLKERLISHLRQKVMA